MFNLVRMFNRVRRTDGEDHLHSHAATAEEEERVSTLADDLLALAPTVDGPHIDGVRDINLVRITDDEDHLHSHAAEEERASTLEDDLLALAPAVDGLYIDGVHDIIVDDVGQALDGYGYNGYDDGFEVDDGEGAENWRILNNDGVADPAVQTMVDCCYRMSVIRKVQNDQTRSLKLGGSAWESFADQSNYSDFYKLKEALDRNQSLEAVHMNQNFLMSMNVRTWQLSLFMGIAKLPSLRILDVGSKSNCVGADSSESELSPEAIDLNAVYFALRFTRKYLRQIKIAGLSLQNDESHVEQLAEGVGRHGHSLRVLKLEDIRVDTENVQPPFMLDPILQAMVEAVSRVDCRPSGLNEFALTCCNNNAPDGPSLISADALDRFLDHVPSTNMDLQGLGLTDEHCRTLRKQLGSEDASEVVGLDLRRNPGIGQEGFEALVGILASNSGSPSILVDDPAWAAKLEMLTAMHRYCDLKSYMELGTFASRDQWVEFMCKVVASGQVSDATKTAALDYTIREYPHLIAA